MSIYSSDEAIEKLDEFVASLVWIAREASHQRDFAHGNRRLDLWVDRLSQWLSDEVSADAAQRLAGVRGGLRRGDPSGNFARRCQAYESSIRALTDDMRDDPEHWDDVILAPDDDDELEAVGSSGSGATTVFLGHGRNLHWHGIARFLEKELGVSVVAFESESRASRHNAEVVEEMLGASSFAAIVVTAEDATKDGSVRARQNVIHELGLAQSHFGRKGIVLLVQRGTELPSNLDGIQVLRFTGDRIDECFEGLRGVLQREELI